MHTPRFRDLESACARVGIVCPCDASRITSNAWTLTAVEGHRKGNTAGRLRLFPEGNGGIAYNWITGEKAVWSEDVGRRFTEEEIKQRKIEQERARRIAEADQLMQYKKSADIAANTYKALKSANFDHKYFNRKGLSELLKFCATEFDLKTASASELSKLIGYTLTSRGQPLEGDVLVVPIRDKVNGKIWSLQFIDGDGRKSMLRGGKIKNNAWYSYRYEDAKTAQDYLSYETIGICEGVATALSISHMFDCYTVAAMSCTNLKNVAASVHKKFPEARIIIFGDLGNGEHDAYLAAAAVNGEAKVPYFTEEELTAFMTRTGSSHPTDFNDLMIARETVVNHAHYQD